VLRKSLAFLPVAAVSALLLTPICGALHRCGCRASWAGGKDYCNARAPSGPHCPWCEHPALGAVASAVVFGGQLLVFGAVSSRASLLGAAAAAVAALPLLSVAGGAIAWLPTDYPHFLAENARSRLGLPQGPIHCYAQSPHAH
jgi:hypothetical protein